MQDSFSEAWINRTDHVVYGRKLNPFCLLHLLFLSLDRNAAYFGKEPTIDSLISAVLVCSSKPEDLSAGRHTLQGWRKKVWLYGALLQNFDAELAKFRSYIADFDSKPEFWQSDDGGSLRAPAILSIATYLEMKTNMTEREIYTAPIGKMYWKSAAIAEMEGNSRAEIMTDEEAEFLKTIEQEGQDHG